MKELHILSDNQGTLDDHNFLLVAIHAFVCSIRGPSRGLPIHGKQSTGGFDPHEYCPKPGPDCSAEYILPESERKQNEWWVKIKLPDGREGWTDQASKFDGRDACG